MRPFAIAALAVLGVLPVSAKVVDSQTNGFVIQQTVQIAAPPDKVYAALIQPATWWNSGHTYSGDAKNLSMDAKAGGCFCETLPNGGSVQHATVAYADPGAALTLRGPFGPFQDQGVDGALSFTLTAKDGGTELALQDVIGGYMAGGFGDWGAKADAMLAEQVARLKKAVETGTPD
jgi:uncharacterized protein YndB with AHSA1/START domain